MNKKFLRRILATSMAFSALTFTAEIYFPPIVSVVHAEVKEYVGVGESIVSDRETIDIGKQGARLQAIRNAQEKAGIFISSYSVMKDQELETDEVIAFTAGIVKINDNIKYEPIPLGDDLGTIKYRATVVVTIDTDDLTAKINQWLGKTSQDRSTLTEQSRDLNNTLERIQTRTTEIETAVAGASSPVDATKIQAEIKELDKDILYAQRLAEAAKYTKLINAGNATADNYFMRAKAFGFSYINLAFADFDKAIELDPTNSEYFYARSEFYWRAKKDYDAAIADISKAIELEPDNESYLYTRAQFYFAIKDYNLAAKDFERLTKLPTQRPEYEERPYQNYDFLVRCYELLGDKEKAIEACMAASKDKNLDKFRRDQFKDIAKRIQKSK